MIARRQRTDWCAALTHGPKWRMRVLGFIVGIVVFFLVHYLFPASAWWVYLLVIIVAMIVVGETINFVTDLRSSNTTERGPAMQQIRTGPPTKFEYIAEHGIVAYYIDPDTGDYRIMPPTGDSEAFDSWGRDLSQFKARRR